MAQQNVLLRAKGLYTFPQRLQSVPSGSLLIADNVVINRDEIVESRRGFKVYGTEMESSDPDGTIAKQLLNYKNRIIRHFDNGYIQQLQVDSDGLGTFTSFDIVLTAQITNLATGVGGIVSTSTLFVGMLVTGTGIPDNTTISQILNNNTIIISQAATATDAAASLTFTYKVNEVVSGLRLKSIEQNGNLYFTTSEGIKKISAASAATLASSVITNAGGIKALDIKADINDTLGFLSPDSVVGYRAVWGIKDNNSNLILGAPSERVIVNNTDSTDSKTVDVRITIPREVTTAHFYQLYRTAVFSTVLSFSFSGDTTNTSTTISNIADTSSLSSGMEIIGTGIPSNTFITSISSASTIEISNAATATNTGVSLTINQDLDQDPGDEQRLVYEANPTLTDLTNGYIIVNDITPDSFRGADLYTNQNTGEGILQANDIPPLAQDITEFKGYTFYANTQTRQRLDLSLLSISELKPFLSGGVTTNSMANPTVITSVNHGLVTGRTILITGSNSTPTIDGSRVVTVIDEDTFSVPVNVTVAGTSGIWSTTDSSLLTITDGTTSNAYSFGELTLSVDTHTNTTIDNISNTALLTAGLSLSGNDIDDGTVIVSIDSGTSITVSKPTLATTSGSRVTFAREDESQKMIALSQLSTPSQQVDETSRSLIRIVNSQDSEIVNVFYLSGVNDIPGTFLFEARVLNQIAFYLTVEDADTTGISFSPALPESGQAVISTNERAPNRIYYSKYQQPEAVPLLNYIDVGPKDKEIKRIVSLRDSLFILKEEGIYRLSGSTTPFQIFPFDFSTHIEAPDSAVVLNNLIYMFSDQGIATISDTGVSVISRPIEDQLIKLLSPNYTNFDSATFGVSYESDRAYYLFTVTATDDDFATQCFRFNTFTNTFTRLLLDKNCGIINVNDNKLYLGPTDISYLEQERKNFNRTDLADREYTRTIGLDAITDGTTIQLSSVGNISSGDVATQVQSLTIKQFNRLLTKLDNDPILLSSGNYFSTLESTTGDDLSDKLDDLINKLAVDASRVAQPTALPSSDYTNLLPTGASFLNQQSQFNDIIDLLNTDEGIGYKNYIESSGTTTYEFLIEEVSTEDSSITISYEYPLIQGSITIYNHIENEIQYVPQWLTDVSMTKQVSEGTYIFEDSAFTKATVSYSSDLSADFEDLEIAASGPGLYGNMTYGEGVYGGGGNGVPFRTLIPRDKQRCRYLNLKFRHSIAREIYYLYGISLNFNITSSKGWR